MAIYTANDLTNDAYNRGKVTVNVLTVVPDASNNKTTITWNVVVSDGNSSYGGYSYNSPSGTGAYATGTISASNGGTISGTSSINTGYQSYDFGSGVVSSPYFPRTLGTYTATVTHSTAGAASITASAVLQGNADPLGYASCSTGAKVLTPFTGPLAAAAPSVSRVSGTPTSISITAAVPSSAGSASITRYEYDWSTTDFSNSTPVNLVSFGAGAIRIATKSGLTATQGYYVRTRAISYDVANSWGYGPWSNSTFIAGVPSIPTAPTISNVVTTSLQLDWTAPANNGATISSYTVQYSTNSGSTWTNLAIGLTSTTYSATNLTIGATYQFRIIAINSSGPSDFGAASASQLVSAYGYRFTSASARVALTMVAVYTDNQSDSVTLNGVSYPGWKQVSNVKRYDGATETWIKLQT